MSETRNGKDLLLMNWNVTKVGSRLTADVVLSNDAQLLVYWLLVPFLVMARHGWFFHVKDVDSFYVCPCNRAKSSVFCGWRSTKRRDKNPTAFRSVITGYLSYLFFNSIYRFARPTDRPADQTNFPSNRSFNRLWNMPLNSKDQLNGCRKTNQTPMRYEILRRLCVYFPFLSFFHFVRLVSKSFFYSYNKIKLVTKVGTNHFGNLISIFIDCYQWS